MHLVAIDVALEVESPKTTWLMDLVIVVFWGVEVKDPQEAYMVVSKLKAVVYRHSP